MNTFFEVLIVGMAVTYTIELLSALTPSFISPKLLRNLLVAPLSLLALWLLGNYEVTLVIATLAAGFFSATALHLLNRPVSVQTLSSRRY